MSDITQLLAVIPVDQIADRLGVDEATARDGVAAALPALLGGLEANVQDSAGAASLLSALGTKDTSLVANAGPRGVRLADVDEADGEKIVRNIFGTRTDDVVTALGSAPGRQESGLVQRILPMLAPIVLGFLARRLTGGSGDSGDSGSGVTGPGAMSGVLEQIFGHSPSSAGSAGSAGNGGAAQGGIGDVLGGLLGGLGGGGSAQSSGLGDVGDVLGGILGRGGAGGLLDGLLGGGKR